MIITQPSKKSWIANPLPLAVVVPIPSLWPPITIMPIWLSFANLIICSSGEPAITLAVAFILLSLIFLFYRSSFLNNSFRFNIEALEYLKRELEKIADEAITDCYDEYEQIAGWCAYLEDEIDLPCKCKVGQKEGLLIGFDTNKDGSSLLAVVDIDMNEYKVAAETVSILNKTSKYLEAFKMWL